MVTLEKYVFLCCFFRVSVSCFDLVIEMVMSQNNMDSVVYISELKNV